MIVIKRLWAILFVGMLVFAACDQGSVTEGPHDVLENQEVIETIEPSDLSETNDSDEEIETQDSTIDEIIEATTDETTDETTTDQEVVLSVVDYEALQVNELGHIMVVMYHGIKDNPPYHRTKEDFIKDLTYMYEHGYRLIGMSDYLNQTISVEAGMTPIVLTFDDGLSSTFSLIETSDGLVVNPDSAVGIIEDFVDSHPDFGKAATLFIHDTKSNFRGDGTINERLEWLLEHGYELGNHSATHADLSQLDGDSLVKEIGQVDEFLNEIGMDVKLRAMTYPYGKKPDDSLIYLLDEGIYKDYPLQYQVGFREGPSGLLYCPLDIRFNPYSAPRVRGSEGEVQDMWWFLNHYDVDHPELKYVSDGNPDTVVIPQSFESKVNRDKLNDKNLILY